MSDFKIDFVSEANKEHLLVEIYYKNQRLCQINKEHGSENLEVEFLSDIYLLPNDVIMKFPLSEFEAILKDAREGLLKCE